VGAHAWPRQLLALSPRPVPADPEIFVSDHRPLQAYADALADAGLLIERLCEPAVPESAVGEERSRRWQRVPLFLHVRAVKALG
jgi:hypothetical protein